MGSSGENGRGTGQAGSADARATGDRGTGKALLLAEAIRRHVRPGQVIHAGNGWGFPTALLYEVVRQFWGRDPGFTLVVAGASSTNVVPFLRGGLVRRVVSSFAGDGYPHPGPNPVIQEARRAWAARTVGEPRARLVAEPDARPVEFEDWSLLTFTLRLLAGAMGLPFLPTRSLVGSDLGREAEVAGLFKVVPDPFAGAGEGESSRSPIGLVKALRPDVSLTHAWAADPDGNALFTLPLAGNVYGALAAREGVIVSAERIVDRGYLAAHSDLVRLPAHRVLAVVEAPFGAHPTGLHHYGLREAEQDRSQPQEPDRPGLGNPGSGPGVRCRGYAEDRDFILEIRAACEHPEAIDAWIKRWILDLPDHRAYLARLGQERLEALQARLGSPWTSGNATEPWEPGGREPPSPAERLICLAAGVVADEIRRAAYPSVLAGVGAAHLACWLAREELAAEGVNVDLMAEVGLVGHRPYPGDPFVFSLQNVPTALMTTDILAVLGMLVPEGSDGSPAPRAGGPGAGGRAAGVAGAGVRHCLGVIGAAQVDRHGNVNSSGAPAAGLWLVGSGGANDVASTAEAVIVVAAQSPTRFVPEVAYVTSPGDRVVAIVSQWGVFRRLPPSGDSRAPGQTNQGCTLLTPPNRGEFALAAYYDDPAQPGAEAAICRVREKCGWDLRVFPDPQPLPPLRPEVIRRLRLFDPYGHIRA